MKPQTLSNAEKEVKIWMLKQIINHHLQFTHLTRLYPTKEQKPVVLIIK